MSTCLSPAAGKGNVYSDICVGVRVFYQHFIKIHSLKYLYVLCCMKAVGTRKARLRTRPNMIKPLTPTVAISVDLNTPLQVPPFHHRREVGGKPPSSNV